MTLCLEASGMCPWGGTELPSPGRAQGKDVWLLPTEMLWRTFLHWVGRSCQRPQGSPPACSGPFCRAEGPETKKTATPESALKFGTNQLNGWGLPRQLSGKESAYQCRRHKRCGFNPWVGKIPWVGNDYPLQYSCLGSLMDRGVRAGYSPWGRKRVRHYLATKTMIKLPILKLTYTFNADIITHKLEGSAQ